MKIRLCPKCKSDNVGIEITAGAALGAPQMWKCNKCGFQSYAIFPEKEEEKVKRRKK